MAPFLFVTDLDNTLVGDDAALAILKDKLSQSRQNEGTKIIYATGRSRTLYEQLKVEKSLLEPDALILSVGTEIYLGGSDTFEPSWVEQLSQEWDRDLVVATTAHFSDLVAQPDSEQGQFKVSYYLNEPIAKEVIPRLESMLEKRGLNVKLVYSSGQDLDILPAQGNKGLAMQFMAQQWGFKGDRTVACGDSGNDITLFDTTDNRGIIVGNAKPELRQWHEANPSPDRYLAQGACAAGILEGLEHFGFLRS